jgi:hypothetical protein
VVGVEIKLEFIGFGFMVRFRLSFKNWSWMGYDLKFAFMILVEAS